MYVLPCWWNYSATNKMLLFAVFLSAGSVSWVCMCVRFMTMTCFPCITSAHIFLFRPFLSLTPISLFVSSLVLTDISFATKMRFCFMWCSEQKHHFWLRQNKKNRPELMNGFELPFFFRATMVAIVFVATLLFSASSLDNKWNIYHFYISHAGS